CWKCGKQRYTRWSSMGGNRLKKPITKAPQRSLKKPKRKDARLVHFRNPWKAFNRHYTSMITHFNHQLQQTRRISVYLLQSTQKDNFNYEKYFYYNLAAFSRS